MMGLKVKELIDWTRYKKLAPIFENRPIENVYWTELLALVEELEAKGVLDEEVKFSR